MSLTRQDNQARLLSPRHIAFVGGRDAELAIREAGRIGYKGQIWPVNPPPAKLAATILPTEPDCGLAPMSATDLGAKRNSKLRIVMRVRLFCY